jgi:hypothetical protein
MLGGVWTARPTIKASPPLLETRISASADDHQTHRDMKSAGKSLRRSFPDGPSVFAYAESSPLENTDPQGLLIGPYSPLLPADPNVLCGARIMDCNDAYAACLGLRGLFAGGKACGDARRACLAGSTTIFAPGIVGAPGG